MTNPKTYAQDGYKDLLENLGFLDMTPTEEREYLELQLTYCQDKISALKRAISLAQEFEASRKKYARSLAAVENVIDLSRELGFGDVADYVEDAGAAPVDDSSDVEQWVAEVKGLRWQLSAYEEAARLLRRTR